MLGYVLRCRSPKSAAPLLGFVDHIQPPWGAQEGHWSSARCLRSLVDEIGFVSTLVNKSFVQAQRFAEGNAESSNLFHKILSSKRSVYR